jgi:hypothetical protein
MAAIENNNIVVPIELPYKVLGNENTEASVEC